MYLQHVTAASVGFHATTHTPYFLIAFENHSQSLKCVTPTQGRLSKQVSHLAIMTNEFQEGNGQRKDYCVLLN